MRFFHTLCVLNFFHLLSSFRGKVGSNAFVYTLDKPQHKGKKIDSKTFLLGDGGSHWDVGGKWKKFFISEFKHLFTFNSKNSEIIFSAIQTKSVNLLFFLSLLDSYIRHKDFRLPSVLCLPWRSCYPPWILKRGGLESSGQRIISSMGKTKRTAFFSFFGKKKIFKNF